MPNAVDAKTESMRIFLVGDTGNGKTTQFLTLPGKKYLYIFDPNALRSVKGHDVDYDLFLPTSIPAGISSLKKSKEGDARAATSSVYEQFETEFDQRIKSGFFDPYEWIGFDSATTLLDLMMDRVLSINGRLGQWPHEDDWGPQMIGFMNLCRTVTAMKKNLFMTGHMQDKTNRKTGVTRRQPMLTGSLVQRIPLLFSEVLGADVDTDANGKSVYRLHTVPDHEFTVIRTSMKGLEPVETVTIDWTKPVVGQGLGGIINWSQKNPNGNPNGKPILEVIK